MWTQYGDICWLHELEEFFPNLFSLNFVLLETFTDYHHTPLVRWSFHKYKYLWGVGGKGRVSSLQEGASHTYTLKLG